MQFDLSSVKSINDSASTPLLVGEHIYKCTHTRWSERKDNGVGTGEFSLIITLVGPDAVPRTTLLSLTASDDVARGIAFSTLKGFWDAAGLSGAASDERFPQLVGKIFRVTTTAKIRDAKTFVNIRAIHPSNENDWREQGLPESAEPVAAPETAAVPWS